MIVAICSKRHHVDDAVGGAELPVRLAEPVQQHAVFGHAVQHAVDADDRRIHRAGENQHAHDHDEDVEPQLQQRRPGQVHHQAADQVVVIRGCASHPE